METDIDMDEGIGLFEPVLLSEGSRHRPRLADLALELACENASLRGEAPQSIRRGLVDLMRIANCHYSNLIEGHHARPADIERAVLRGDYSEDRSERNMQEEARAHVAAQEWIDSGGVETPPFSARALREIHRRFCDPLPESMLICSDPATGKSVKVAPGQIRRVMVRVGRHIPVSPGAVARFMGHFERACGNLTMLDSIMAIPAAHHRLLWIHPFADGNGRVARLMSHAMLSNALGDVPLWPVSRGLALNRARYMGLLANCDLPRRNDWDGRGTLSEEALAEFTEFFLGSCIDQVRLMRERIRPGDLRRRVLAWAREETDASRLPPLSGAVLEEVMLRGALPRADLPALLGVTDRHARRAAAALAAKGVLAASSRRAPWRLAFPAKFVGTWLPDLFLGLQSGLCEEIDTDGMPKLSSESQLRLGVRMSMREMRSDSSELPTLLPRHQPRDFRVRFREWEQTVRKLLGRLDPSAAELAIADFMSGSDFKEFTETISTRVWGRVSVVIAVLPERIAQGKPLLFVNDVIAAKLRFKHNITREDYCKLQGLFKSMRMPGEDFVNVSGKDVGGGKAANRLSGWVRTESEHFWGYAIVWEAKKTRSELVTFFELKTEQKFKAHVRREQSIAKKLEVRRGEEPAADGPTTV